MKKILIISLVFLAAACNQTKPAAPAATSLSTGMAYSYSHSLQIGGQILNVEVANTDASREQGLSDRTTMDESQGMLFEFGQQVRPAFWMKQMNFGLDFIWIDNGQIVGITPDVPAPAQKTSDSMLPLYYPPSPVDEVLEVNAGWAEKNNISVGDDVKVLQ